MALFGVDSLRATLRDAYSRVHNGDHRLVTPLLTDASAKNRIEVSQIQDALLASSSSFVIVGEPGCGKSTIVNRIVLDLLAKDHNAFPVRLKLWRTASTVSDVVARSVISDLRRDLSFAELRLTTSDLSGLVSQALSSAPVCLAFDGLNEIPRDLFESAVSEIQRILDDYHWQRHLLTNRVTHVGLLGSLDLQNWPVIHHRGLSPESAQMWVAGNRELDSASQEALVRAIERGDRLSSLLQNPHRLVMSCNYVLANKEMPSCAAELFREELRASVTCSAQTGKLPVDVRFSMISLIAAEMTARCILVGDLTRAERRASVDYRLLLERARRTGGLGLWANGTPGAQVATAFWSAVECPFVIVEKGRIAFVHESYQDFFSALWLADNINALDKEEYDRILSAPQWRQSVAFALGTITDQRATRRIIDTLLETDDGTIFAAACLLQLPKDIYAELLPVVARRVFEMGTCSPSPDMRVQALDLLSRLGETKLLTVLVGESYADSHWMVREMAALHAGDLYLRINREKILPLFKDGVHWVRAAAVWAAGEARMDDLQSEMEALQQLDPSKVVRGWACFALRRLHRADGRARSTVWYEDYRESGLFPDCVGDTAAEFYTNGLTSGQELTRSTAIEAISEMHHYPAFKKMRELRRDESAYVRAWLMRAIGSAEVYGCADVVVEGVQDNDPWVRFWAAHAAWRLRLQSAVPVLLRQLQLEREALVRVNIMQALASIALPNDLCELQRIDNLEGVDVLDLLATVKHRVASEAPFSLAKLATTAIGRDGSMKYPLPGSPGGVEAQEAPSGAAPTDDGNETTTSPKEAGAGPQSRLNPPGGKPPPPTRSAKTTADSTEKNGAQSADKKIWTQPHCPSCGRTSVEFISASEFEKRTKDDGKRGKGKTVTREAVGKRIRGGKYYTDGLGNVPWCEHCRGKTPLGAGVERPVEGVPKYRPSKGDYGQAFAWCAELIVKTFHLPKPDIDLAPPPDTNQGEVGAYEYANEGTRAIVELAASRGEMLSRDEAEKIGLAAMRDYRDKDFESRKYESRGDLEHPPQESNRADE